MIIFLGIDFTSAPKKGKSICITLGNFNAGCLEVQDIFSISTLRDFPHYLDEQSEWIGGFDLPFSMPLEFINKEFNRPKTWQSWIEEVNEIGETDFYERLERFKLNQPKGKKHLLRQTDQACRSISPMMLYGVPLAKMFYRGVLLLNQQNCSLWPVNISTSNKTAIEVYPGFFAKQIIGNLPYKNDTKAKQTIQQKQNRIKIIEFIQSKLFNSAFKFSVNIASKHINQCVDDPTGDCLDSLIACIQAAWATTVFDTIALTNEHKLEGMIISGPILNQ